VPLRNPEPSGLPNSTELPELSVIEDEICELLESEKESLFVAIVTTGGMQEYVFYTSSPEQVKLKFDQLRGKITSHKIQLMIQPDKDWRVFDQLTRTK
jgi:tyrosine-protein phosphatase YwqE